MKPLLALALLASIALIAPVSRADDNATTAQTAADNAATPDLAGVKCVLRAQNGQGQFRQGETISLVASFTSDRPGYQINMFVRNDRGMATLGAVKVSPAAGVTDPIGELPPPTFLSVAGYVPPPQTLSAKPVEIPFVLNDWARFDRPGVYQVTLSTPRVFVAKPADRKGAASSIFNSNFSASITSEPLQIEIVPADEKWANEQIEITREFWRQQEDLPRSSGLKTPENDISFLGTRAAMTAIIEHLSHNTKPRSSYDDTYLFHTGFIGFADRAWLIGEMQRFSERPDAAVTQGFFGLLTELQSLQSTPRPLGADASLVKSVKSEKGAWIAGQPTPAQQLQIDWSKRRAVARAAATSRDWLRIAAATPAKTAPERAMTLHSLLELAWLTDLEKEPLIKAQLPKLVAQLAPIFDQLPPSPRAYLLGSEWDRIKSPAFAPAIARAAQLPANSNDYYEREARDLALKRLAQLDPKLGRAQIIAQIRQAKPRFGFDALRSLPDATLPELDEVLATNFINARNEDIELSAKLLWRYASAAVLPRIKAYYEDPQHPSDNAALVATLAYFVRVNPGYGVPQVAARTRAIGKLDNYSSLLFDVAALAPGPQLESVAIANLTDAGEGSATDAAQTLRYIGGAAAKDALIARLKNTGDAAYPRVRGHIEWRVVEALADGQGWLTPPAELRQIRALCLTEQGRTTLDNYLRIREYRKDGEPLSVNYSPDGYWGVDNYSGRGMKSFRAKLAQFPVGTAFRWQKLGSGPDVDAAFETTKQWAAERGLKIELWQSSLRSPVG